MLQRALLPAAIALTITAAGCGSRADAGSAGGASADLSQYVGAQQTSGAGARQPGPQGSGPTSIGAIDPCTLLTKEEIATQIEASYSPDQQAGFKSQGGTWTITPTPAEEGISKVCRYTLTGTVKNGDTRQQTEFKLIVTDGAFVNPNVNNAKSRPIPGIGDEAYFMSRGSMMPYARVGNVAVGMEGFPSTPKAKAGEDLLRAAVARVRAR